MKLDELLIMGRNQYIETYQLGLEQHRNDSSAVEIMLQIKADENKSMPEIFQIYRYDLISKNPEGKFDIIEFNQNEDSLLKFDREVYDWDVMKIEITPFYWNGCELKLDQKPYSWDPYYEWTKKWIDIDDQKMVTADGFQNVIHSVTFPEEVDGKWTTSIDLGTSPIDALKELFTVLGRQGVRHIEVYSTTFNN